MSVIVKDEKGNIELLCKGADSIVLARLDKEKSNHVQETLDFIEDYAKEGLRTLLLAKRKLNEQEYNAWNMKFVEALQSVSNREERIAEVNELIEV